MAKKDPGNWLEIQSEIARSVTERVFPLPSGDTIKTILAVDPGIANLAACLVHFSPKQMLVKTTKFEQPKYTRTFDKIAYLSEALHGWLIEHTFMSSGKDRMTRADILIKESIAHGYPGGVADAGRVQHMLELLADRCSIPFLDVNPQAMRAYLGSKAKSDTKLAVYKKFHVEFPSEDECDVFAIAMTGLALIKGDYVPKSKKK